MMTDSERQELEQRAKIEADVLIDKMLPRLRIVIWQAAASFSLLAGSVVYFSYRSDFAALRAEIRAIKPKVAIETVWPQQFNENRISINQSEGLIERETRRLMEARGYANLRGMGGSEIGVATSADR